jgi:hypothetical protein
VQILGITCAAHLKAETSGSKLLLCNKAVNHFTRRNAREVVSRFCGKERDRLIGLRMATRRPEVVRVKDKMQRGYSYSLTAPIGRNFDPEFRPELTPKEMLALGVFCGKYMTDCREEFPASWFAQARLSQSGRDCSLNYFGVDASQPLSVWRRKGWIHPDDPRGWFQWYCRYYMGRRMPEEDARQIKRWKAIRRHIAQIKRHCEPGDRTCRPRQRQALLHWAYDSRSV